MIQFTNLLNRVYPRVLTQLNRDPHSSTYGSFDRNWWHYKIRDFSSIILQQVGYFLSELGKLDGFKTQKDYFNELAQASVPFWAQRSQQKGAFEEYYPYENGYPPLAFSSLSAAKIIYEQNTKNPLLHKALKTAAHKLLKRFESRAANQQIAGLAALSVIKKVNPELVPNDKFEQIVQKTLNLQDEEGWYMEYDGPDLGYLSVSLDCLWDLYDFTEDKRFLDSAEKAFHFIADLVIEFDGNIGMHNSRNTDYIVPYGISRFLNVSDKNLQSKALTILKILYGNLEDSRHFFNAVDDRYWSHYIGHSIARAQYIMSQVKLSSLSTERPKTGNLFFNNAGYQLFSTNYFSVIISGKKGGVFSIKKDGNYYSDFGHILFAGKQQFVNHWWDEQTQVEVQQNKIVIKGHLVGHKDNNSSPIKHMALRILSYTFGHHIISLLKNQLIFKNKKSNYYFERNLTFTTEKLIVEDQLHNIEESFLVQRAPRFSKRHVASADSYHMEDQTLFSGLMAETNITREKNIYKSYQEISLK